MKNHKGIIASTVFIALFFAAFFVGVIISVIRYFDSSFTDRVYPNVWIGNTRVGGKTKQEITALFLSKNSQFAPLTFTFMTDHTPLATISAVSLDVGFDATFSANQAFMIGRSKYFLSNINDKLLKRSVTLSPSYRYNEELLTQFVSTVSAQLAIEPLDALFSFTDGKVTAFRLSRTGRKVDEQKLIKSFTSILPSLTHASSSNISFPIPIITLTPNASSERADSLGIKEQIGRGYSEFSGSIPGRIHNVALAANRINGVMIAPGEIFSLNDSLGDISAATGYQSAYVIKNGRTVMGDGGGVCQVSSTVFRAALAAGLPIVERKAHSYRVHYYEDGGFKPGLDATIFAPTEDLKFKNDTGRSILIQTTTDTKHLTLTVDFYGTNDGRKAEILNHVVWGISPPPAPLYQDDPTLPVGVVNQVDFAAWGAKASFQYKVIRDTQTLIDETFTSHYQPWQAVYLKGTRQ